MDPGICYTALLLTQEPFGCLISKRVYTPRADWALQGNSHDKGLGQRLLRLGVLTDTHVSLGSRNGKRLYASSRSHGEIQYKTNGNTRS